MRTGEQRILLAEDDPAIRKLVGWTLDDEGLTIDEAADGEAAIDYLAARRPALLILDVMMPRADGFQVAEALRSIHGHRTPILVLTAAGDARDAARQMDAEAYLAKPFEIERLIAKVNDLLEPSRPPPRPRRAEAEDAIDTAAGG
jgi:DNA-binding response OmpR family regulator